MQTMNEKKQQRHVFLFSALQKIVLIPSMYFAIYSKSKNMSVGKVYIKLYEFACMTILSPETVSIVLCQCSIMNMQVPPVPSQPKAAEILVQNASKCIKNAHIINQKFNCGEPPSLPYKRGYPLSCSLSTRAFALTSAGPLLNTWRRAWTVVDIFREDPKSPAGKKR